MPKIFLCYRRLDSAGVAGRIYDRLRAHFGDDAIFMDIDSIPFGVDFREYIASAVDQCGVLLAVIGRDWAGETGTPRWIDDPRDFVRIEIESALERDLPVVPILIDRARMPAEADLPPSLARLAYRNAIELDQGRDFHPHVDRLIKGIEVLFHDANRVAVDSAHQPEKPAIVIPTPREQEPSRKPRPVDAAQGPKASAVSKPQPARTPIAADPVKPPKARLRGTGGSKSKAQARPGGTGRPGSAPTPAPTRARSQEAVAASPLPGSPPARRSVPGLRVYLTALPLLAVLGIIVHIVTDTGRVEESSRPAPSAPKVESPSPTPKKGLTNSIGMNLIWIPAGGFLMGSDESDRYAEGDEFLDLAAGKRQKHRVRIPRPFYLGATEVTRGQFRRFVVEASYRTDAEKDGKGGTGWNETTKHFDRNNPKFTWQNTGFGEQTDDHPVVHVSWNDVQAFITWLSRKEGRTYRLPTEAEWEYACRAGTTTRFSFGDDPEGLAAFGNVADAVAKEKYPTSTMMAARDGYAFTAPVGHYKPNAWGLYDMHGNVWEWCSDGYAADYYKESPVDDPPGAVANMLRVIRGGSWSREPRDARSAGRHKEAAPARGDYLGFRLVLEESGR